MHRIDTFVFWMGGVVTQHLSQTVVEVLELHGRPADFRTRRALVDLEEGLCRGALHVEDYCKRVVERAGLARCFSEPVLFTAEYGLADCGPALLEKLLASGEIARDSTLWVDDHPHRAMSAIRLAIDTAIFVDAPRLRRDLGLWGLLPLL